MTDAATQTMLLQTIALCRFAGVQPRLMQALLTYFENLDRILKADAGALMTVQGMATEQANAITRASDQIEKAQQFYDVIRSQDINLVSRFEPDYPQRLFELNDPPSFLYYKGKLPSPELKIAAIVGTSKASNNGLELTAHLAKACAEQDVQIISGIDSGISSSAHLSAAAADGISFGVVRSGFGKIQPESSLALANDISARGGIITEHSPEFDPPKDEYKASNRIIASIAQAVVITEFYHDSEEVMDLLLCCSEIGKLVFLLIDPKHGALTEEKAINAAVTHGAIPMVGLDKIDDIIKALV